MLENSLDIEERYALFTIKEELFNSFRFDIGSGIVQSLLTTILPSSRIALLHIAAMFSDIDQALNCIENGADVDLEGPYLHSSNHITMQVTPLVCAILACHEDMVRTLVSRGTRLSRNNNSVSESPVIALAHQWPVLQHCASDIHSMLACLKYLGWDLSTPVNFEGDSMLHIAAKTGAVDLARALIVHGLKPLTMNVNRETPLHTACGPYNRTVNFIELASALLQDEPLEQLDRRDKNGRTVLHHAFLGSDLEEIIRKAQHLLERGSDVFAKDKNGNIPLTFAILNEVGALGLRTLLSSHKADQLASRNLERQTLLQAALTKGNPYVLAELLRSGAYPFIADAAGRNPIEVIAETYKPEDFTPSERQAWRKVWKQLGGWREAEEAIDQLEKRNMEFDKKLSHPRTTNFFQSPIWSLGKSKNK